MPGFQQALPKHTVLFCLHLKSFWSLMGFLVTLIKKIHKLFLQLHNLNIFFGASCLPPLVPGFRCHLSKVHVARQSTAFPNRKLFLWSGTRGYWLRGTRIESGPFMSMQLTSLMDLTHSELLLPSLMPHRFICFVWFGF